jgi:hypothetical protein
MTSCRRPRFNTGMTELDVCSLGMTDSRWTSSRGRFVPRADAPSRKIAFGPDGLVMPDGVIIGVREILLPAPLGCDE